MTAMKTPTRLLTISDLTLVQTATVDRLYDCDLTFLIAVMGSGKTVSTLTAASELLAEGVITRVLVFAPLKVCDNVWQFEHEKWEHLKHLRVHVATGDAKQRKAAVEVNSDILVVNIENLPWFFETFKDGHGCDGLVIDELSKFKANSSKGVKKLKRRLAPFKWVVGMTGTPVAENWTGLYSQMIVLDGGKRLGTNHQVFLDKYFYPTDHMRLNWALRDGSAELLVEAISDVVYTMPSYTGELPPIEYWVEDVTMPKEARVIYDKLKKDMLVQIEEGELVVASNAAVLTNKLLQAASGFLYTDEGVESLHYAKLDCVQRLIDEATGPVLLAYWFDADKEALAAMLGCPIYGQSKSKVKTKILEDEWNAGKHKVMMLHPASASHGLNLQAGGCVVIWFGPVWSRDMFTQLNARLWRKGQTKPVDVVVIETVGTIDALVSARVSEKGKHDTLLMKHLLER